MRQLTDVEVTEEVRKIRTRAWPYVDILPVKNLYRNVFTDENGLGRIHQAGMNGPVVVFLGCMFLPPNESKMEIYPDLEEMVKAGWVGD